MIRNATTSETGVVVPDVVGLFEYPGEDRARGHSRGDRRGDPREEQGDGKDMRCASPQERLQERIGLLQLLHGCFRREEGRCGQQDHRAVDRPAHQHREDRVCVFVAQLSADDRVVAQVPLAALDHLRM